jgi:hypothetical protein
MKRYIYIYTCFKHIFFFKFNSHCNFYFFKLLVGLGFRVTELVTRVVVVVPMPHNNGKPHPWTLPMSLFFSSVETRQSIKLFCVLLKV